MDSFDLDNIMKDDKCILDEEILELIDILKQVTEVEKKSILLEILSVKQTPTIEKGKNE